MSIKPSRDSRRIVVSILLTLIAILPLSSCNHSGSTPQIASPDAVNISKSPDLDRFVFRRNDKFGFIDRTGKIVISAKFDRITENFSEGVVAVSIGEKWGYIDRTGRIVIPPRFKYAAGFKQGLARVTDGNVDVMIDKTGKVVATAAPDPAEEATQSESDELISFEENDKVGYKDRTGKIVVPAKFNVFSYYPNKFHDGLKSVCINKKCGYIDKNGKIVVPIQFDLVAEKFSDGLAWVNIGDKLGYVNKTGKLVIPARYGSAYIFKGCRGLCDSGVSPAVNDFNCGLALVQIPECKQAGKKNCNRYGYIDTTGKLVFEF